MLFSWQDILTLSSDEYEFYSLGELREIWQKLPNQDAINAVAEAHQYYDFLNDMMAVINKEKDEQDIVARRTGKGLHRRYAV